jgi:uncharacterized membrane protein YbaN (DUF454 family)
VTLLWRVIAVVCVVLGFIGLLLPIVPTVPFLLLAAAAASRGWPWLEERLLSHATFGPMIVRWRERRVIPRRAKWMATWGMAAGSAFLWFTPAPTWLQIAVPVVMLLVAFWIWLRPEN